MYEKRKRSEFGIYEGYSEPCYKLVRRISLYVPMEDGVGLAVDCYIPQTPEGEDAPALPVIFHYTPYDRCVYTGEMKHGIPQTKPAESIGLLPLTGYGYVLAIAQVRGTGASFGIRKVVNSRQEAQDGAQLVQWLGSQPFCNGVVGTAGMSYHGQTQLEIISCRPSCLKAAFIGHTDFNRYDGWVRNGIPRAFGSSPDFVWGETETEQQAQVEAIAEKTPPVDDDPDGLLLRMAIREHIKNGAQITVQKELIYRDSSDERFGGDVWRQLSASTYLEDMNASGVAIYLTGGCFDVFRRDTFMMNANLTLPHKLALGPWYHVERKEDPEWTIEILRWFDHYLKGINNGIMAEPPLTLRVVNFDFKNLRYCGPGTGYYRFEQEWKPSQAAVDYFYPANGRQLCGEIGLPHTLTYRAVYGIKTSCEDKITTREDSRGVDDLGEMFTSLPVEEDMVIIGHPMARVVFSLPQKSDEDIPQDIDFFITLSDYDPETRLAFQFGDGHLRASLREAAPPPYDFLGIPWHSCQRNAGRCLEADERYSLEIDIMPVSYCIKTGHCLRMTISNSLDRTYYIGRENYETDAAGKGPAVTLYLGGAHGCRLTLPDQYGDRKNHRN